MTATATLEPTSSTSMPIDTTVFHVGLNVADLDRSVRFYTVLLGCPPRKHYGDYARFEIAEPPLVVALYPSPQTPGGALNHVGLRLRNSADLVDVQRRLEQAGMRTQRQDDVECCYSRQTKFWITDPDSNLWEIYTLHEDLEHSGFIDPPVAANSSLPQTVWEHRLTEPIPHPLPFNDESVDEIRLEGTFNLQLPLETLPQLLQEAHRALRAGGRIVIHGLVGDRPFPGTPRLPGMAALVQRVPVETEPAEYLRAAHFVDLHLDKQGDIHCFQVNGVELRELRISAVKSPSRSDEVVQVIYKGPFAEIELDDGVVIRRGELLELPQSVAHRLTTGPAASAFGILRPGDSGEA
jgi:catechol 2,3-dioxygenase-like lactoylglutathione lyase family enzyme